MRCTNMNFKNKCILSISFIKSQGGKKMTSQVNHNIANYKSIYKKNIHKKNKQYFYLFFK